MAGPAARIGNENGDRRGDEAGSFPDLTDRENMTLDVSALSSNLAPYSSELSERYRRHKQADATTAR